MGAISLSLPYICSSNPRGQPENQIRSQAGHLFEIRFGIRLDAGEFGVADQSFCPRSQSCFVEGESGVADGNLPERQDDIGVGNAQGDDSFGLLRHGCASEYVLDGDGESTRRFRGVR